jgi:succinate dehydrogenase / fumarate reductase cytochrome b subunit|uniref:Succinate dehydrogenase subunit 3 n=1 Tax=Seculamonas ecuadoriensis TaxID=221724 RepID=M4QEF4_SECEC|nr:succinate dehydrogenase subunit 3 [Seculamonas ecuadoriensis]AGH24480.1 succinate dehydrogenase subunit 3 [Seculamonas ecuadoriensis]
MNISRPISPHLTTYAPQVTSVLSLFHRVTGVALTVMLFVFVVLFKFFTFHLNSYAVYSLAYFVNNYSNWVLLTVGFLLLASLYYHLLNGLRHLLWDTGYALDLKSIYLSGYIVIALTVILSLIIWSIF